MVDLQPDWRLGGLELELGATLFAQHTVSKRKISAFSDLTAGRGAEVW